MSGFSGLKAWVLQRFSGIYIAIFTLLLIFLIWKDYPFNYEQWTALFSQGWLQVSFSLFVLALLLHAWIGLRDVILDYIKPMGIKMLLMSIIVIMLLGSGVWLLKSLLMVASA